jgi:hypothetical protein
MAVWLHTCSLVLTIRISVLDLKKTMISERFNSLITGIQHGHGMAWFVTHNIMADWFK